MPALFATTLLVSAILLFLVQPMVAKMVLPVLGGTPAVWNTCLLFFQALLLLGYTYAHLLSSKLPLRKQVFLHIAVLLIASVALPIGLAQWTLSSVPRTANPAGWLLLCLLASAGLPFLAVSTNAPLLQSWFSRLHHRSSADPYFLYAASNGGSLLALMAYPFLIEPRLRLSEQSRSWAFGFFILIGLVLLCGLCAMAFGHHSAVTPDASASRSESGSVDARPGPVSFPTQMRWLFLAFVPSSLMLGVTTYLTTDIASIPLLWILPLSLYLITFIVAFAPGIVSQPRWPVWSLPLGVIGLTYLLVTEATQPVAMIIFLHLAVFFVAAMLCHTRLAATRPSPQYLTEFYLWISLGGVLGGVFNVLVAPLVFNRITEYPLSIVAACCLRPSRAEPDRASFWRDFFPAFVVWVLAVLLLKLGSLYPEGPIQLRLGLVYGLPLLVCFLAVDKPIRFALAIGSVLLASATGPGVHGKPLYLDRNFFGALRITLDPAGPFYRLVHGNTVHGRQAMDRSRSREPLSYYHRTGPIGQIFSVFKSRPGSKAVAVIGLGAGAMACYATPDERWTFYEINPAVVRIAKESSYFTFLRECQGTQMEIVLGDARLRLQDAPPGQYNLLVVDAFSSDAIPLHLITREALALYLSKLAPGGLLAFHISNRYLELEDVLGTLARDAGLLCHGQEEMTGRAEIDGKDPSHWVVMGRNRADFGKLAHDSRWLPVRGGAKARVWTDDFCDLIRVFHWN